MRVLINATAIASGNRTGIERFAERISQELYRIDETVGIVSSRSIPGVPLLNRPRLLEGGSALLGRREYLLRALWDQTLFRRRAIRERADLVFFPIQDGLLYPPMRQVITVHDLHYLHFRDSGSECREELNTIRTSLYRGKMPHLLSRSAAVIAVSEATKRDLLTHFDIGADKIHVIYNGFDDSRFRPAGRPEGEVIGRYGLKPGYFLYVGSVLRHKNLVRLVQAYGKLQDERQLVIAGACKDRSYLDEVLAAAGSLGVSSKIRYLDYVPDDDLPDLYNGAAALVLPSLHEGFGVPLVEAMACGTPVVTSNCSSMPEVAGKAALYVDPTSVESISAAMAEVVGNQSLRTELRVHGLERSRSFLWSTSAKRLHELFETLCGTKTRIET